VAKRKDKNAYNNPQNTKQKQLGNTNTTGKTRVNSETPEK
jgi:hypothetical protein